jgi:ferric-dicitrate binding protein FerR (iron transport regulator)
MQQQDSNGRGGGEMGNDSLAALIRAVGRRAVPPAEHRQRVLAVSELAWQRAVRSRARRQWTYALAASVAGVALGVLAVWRLPMFHRPDTVATISHVVGEAVLYAPVTGEWRPLAVGSGLPDGSRIRTATGGGVQLVLGGNVDLRVDADSELTLRAAGSIDLAVGRLYVDTGADARPGRIDVNTSFGRLTDIGTQFEAQVSLGGLRLRVREGAVSLAPTNIDQSRRCDVGQELRVDTGGRITTTQLPTFDPQWDWVSALAQPPRIEGMAMPAFLAWVSRETGRPLRYASREQELLGAQVILHGSVQDLRPLQALGVVLASTSFGYTLQPDGSILIARRSPDR